jgi:hypothetical protein
MRRRAFIFASGCALLPTGARSQHRAQVGFLHPGSAAVGSRIIAVREGLANAGGAATNAAIIPASRKAEASSCRGSRPISLHGR